MHHPLFSPHKQDEHCPQCGSVLHIRQGKFGIFLGCSAYPDCDYIKPLRNHHLQMIKDLDETCPQCHAFLQLKQGNYGMFIGCSQYPLCDFVLSQRPKEQEATYPCPRCKQGELVLRQGRNGKTFYGCNGYPACKMILPSQPFFHSCPKCGETLAVSKKGKQDTFCCANPHCQHIFILENIDEHSANH